MRLTVFACALFGVLLAAGAGVGPAMANNQERDVGLRRESPDFPASCAPPPGESLPPREVIVAYEVASDGLPENVRVRESDDPCFNEAAVAAVRNWRFSRGARLEVETTFVFSFEDKTHLTDYDAAPRRREPPQYPERCMRSAKSREYVIVEFDVDEKGETRNLRIVESTNPCLDSAATKAVARWLYTPKMVDGEPVTRLGVQTAILFELADPGPLRDGRLNRRLKSRLDRIQKDVLAGGDVDAALAALDEIEAEFSARFSQPDLTIFHLVRGNVRIEAGDYRGALDDFRVVRRTSPGYETRRILDLIERLEEAVAAEDAAAASAEAQASAEPES